MNDVKVDRWYPNMHQVICGVGNSFFLICISQWLNQSGDMELNRFNYVGARGRVISCLVATTFLCFSCSLSLSVSCSSGALWLLLLYANRIVYMSLWKQNTFINFVHFALTNILCLFWLWVMGYGYGYVSPYSHPVFELLNKTFKGNLMQLYTRMYIFIFYIESIYHLPMCILFIFRVFYSYMYMPNINSSKGQAKSLEVIYYHDSRSYSFVAGFSYSIYGLFLYFFI